MLKHFSKLLILLCLISFTANGNLYAFQLTAKPDETETTKDDKKAKRIIKTTTIELLEDYDYCECSDTIGDTFPWMHPPIYIKIKRAIINPFKKIGKFFVSKK